MRRAAFATLVMWSLCTSAWAQSTAAGTIRGVIHDEHGGALSGVAVTATSPTVAGMFTSVSGPDGSYRLLNLSPGEYSMTAALQGFSRYARPGVVVRTGLNVAVDIVLRAGATSETIQAAADSPMLEVQKPMQAVNISGEMQRALPLGTRKDFSEFLEVTPGVIARTFDQGTGGQTYMLRGSEIENHVVQVDGADMGSFRQGWAALYTGLSTDSIEDTQVKTGGADASAPLGVGVVINIATRSGTNQFKGAASAVYQAQRWNDNNAAAGAHSVYNKLFQPDVSLGGPILKDRLLFFGAFRYADRETGIFRTADQLKALAAIDPTFTPFANGGKDKDYYIKATAPFSSKHQLNVFFQRDFNPELAALPIDSKRFNVMAFGGNGFGTRLSSVWRGSVTTQLLAAYNDKSLNGSFDAFTGYTFSNPAQDYYAASFAQGGRRSGIALLATTNNTALAASPTSKFTLQADLTYFKTGALGSHELQTGLLAQPHLTNRDDLIFVNGVASYDELALTDSTNLNSGAVLFHRRIYDAATATVSSRLAQDYAVYVQDAWKPSSRATLNLGVRVDNARVRDRLYAANVQNSWEIGPRVGATYVLSADEKNIVRASYARVADLLQTIYLPSAGGNPVGFTDFYFNPDGTALGVPLRTPPVTPQSSNQVVDPNRHQPFVDEWIGGYRRQLPQQVSLDVSVVRRYYKDRPARQEINRVFNGVAFAGYKNEAQNDIFLVTNNIWNTQVYSGLELTVAKRGRTLNLLAGYTRGWQHLDGTWMPGDPASFIQPGAFPNDKGIGSIRGNETSSLSGADGTRSPSWQKHAFRSGVSYQAPWHVLVASSVVFLAGPYSGPIVTRVAAADPQFGPPTVTLSNGRVVSNPLATTIRFAYDTRGEGQIKAPNLIIWNMRVGRDFRIGQHRLNVALDGINMSNRAADQQFQTGGNQLYNPQHYAMAADGTFRGQSRQPPRSAQILFRFEF